jgi:hypothetical protein
VGAVGSTPAVRTPRETSARSASPSWLTAMAIPAAATTFFSHASCWAICGRSSPSMRLTESGFCRCRSMPGMRHTISPTRTSSRPDASLTYPTSAGHRGPRVRRLGRLPGASPNTGWPAPGPEGRWRVQLRSIRRAKPAVCGASRGMASLFSETECAVTSQSTQCGRCGTLAISQECQDSDDSGSNECRGRGQSTYR